MKLIPGSRRAAAGIAVLTVFTLGATACGGGDKADGQGSAGASKSGDAKADCVLISGTAIGIPSAITAFEGDGNPKWLSAKTLGHSIDDLLTVPELKALNAELESNNAAFGAAKTNAEREELATKQQKVFEDFMAQCGPTFDDESKRAYQSYSTGFKMKTQPAETSETEAPEVRLTVTPPGKAVKVGDTVVGEYTDLNGRTGPVEITVTKIDYMEPDDLKYIQEDDRKEIPQMAYIRGTLKGEGINAENATTRPDLGSPRLKFEGITDDGSSSGSIISFGGFEPCKSDQNRGDELHENVDFCQPIPLAAKTTKVTGVKLVKFGAESTGDPLYTWSN